MNKSSTFAIVGSISVLGAAFLTQPASAQGLRDRVNYVMNKRAQAQATNNSRAEILGRLLYTDLTLEFNETSARNVIDYLKNVLGIQIVGRWLDDRVGTGLDPDTPITLKVEGQNALTILELVLAQAEDLEEATWQLRDGFLEVGTKERLASKSAREIRYYPIRDLLFEPPQFDNAPSIDLDAALQQGQDNQNSGGGRGGGGGGGRGGGGGGGGSGSGSGGGIFDNTDGGDVDRADEEEKAQQLIDLITEIVEPEAWDTLGGDWATVRYYSGTLIVNAPDFIQRQIGGYPFAIRPAAARNSRSISQADRRYVMFTGGFSNVSNGSFRSSQTTGGAAGGAAADTSRSVTGDAKKESVDGSSD